MPLELSAELAREDGSRGRFLPDWGTSPRSSCVFHAIARTGIACAPSWGMNNPSNPQNPNTNPVVPHEPIDPDPKGHPIHPEIPMQPIHEGTDPKQPIMPEKPGPQ